MGPSTASTSRSDAVHHVHDALDFAAEVGMAGRVHDVDGDALVVDAGILGQNGDAALALQVVGIEDAFGHLLVGVKDIGLAQHAIDQRGLAVIDMGDDGNVANVGAGDSARRRVGVHCENFHE